MQHSVARLVQCCNHAEQSRNNFATLCCAKNRRCESPRVTLPVLFLNLDIFLKNSTPGEFAYQGSRRGGAGGGGTLANFSGGKIYFFNFGYPDLSLATQTRFSILTILNTDKQRTEKPSLVAVANDHTFRESDLKMSG